MSKYIKDPGSAITHFIGFLFAFLFGGLLIKKAELTGSHIAVIAMCVFICSMMLLYGASTTYHTINIPGRINLLLKRVDHAMIFVLIAGSYTPVCLLALPEKIGIPLLIYMWVSAAVGILVKIFIINCPKWISSVIYIAMGWTVVFVLRPLLAVLPPQAFYWLLAGGIIYTVGGIIYGIPLPSLEARLPKDFGRHEIFHLFVLGGSFCHFMFMYLYLV